MSQQTEFEKLILARATAFSTELVGNTLNAEFERSRQRRDELELADRAIGADIAEIERAIKTLQFALDKRKGMQADIREARKANYEHLSAIEKRRVDHGRS